MGLIERQQIIDQLSPPADSVMAAQLVDEFVSLERRYIQRDWGPAELDGGQFCEALARIVLHLDSGTLNHSKTVDECVKYVENEPVQHRIAPRTDAKHLMKVVQTIYKFRSARGAVHITPSYEPNHMDAKLVAECVRWCMAEALRMFSKADREQVAKAIRELLQFDVPCIGQFQDVLLVQRTDVTAEEEMLLLLHYAGEEGFSRTSLGRHAALLSAPNVTRAIQKLEQVRQVVRLSNGNYVLTDLGHRRVREQLAAKLVVG